MLAGMAASSRRRLLAALTPLRDGPRRLGVLMGNLADDPVAQAYTASLMRAFAASVGRRASICALTGAGPAADPTRFDASPPNWWRSARRAAGAVQPVRGGVAAETSTLPIVFTMVTDPSPGFCQSLARRAANHRLHDFMR